MKKINLLLLLLLSTISFGQITYSKDAWGKTIATNQQGKVLATYSEDAWGNTIKKDEAGNVQGTYSKNAWGNTVYTPTNDNRQTDSNQISVSKFTPMTFNEILQLQQMKNNEKSKHDYGIQALEYYEKTWIALKDHGDAKFFSDFIAVGKIKTKMYDDYESNNNIDEAVIYATQIFTNLDKAINELLARKEEFNRKKLQIKEYYNSLKPYLKSTSDGWHDALAMDNSNLCESRKVYVTNNTITTYLNGDGDSLNFNFGKIIDGKTMIQTINKNGGKNMLDIYFIEIL